ncbi:YceI family protein [candidate division KSB1 bacterium]|nr:YceI family protein [candidate division KSB1 bacterium]
MLNRWLQFILIGGLMLVQGDVALLSTPHSQNNSVRKSEAVSFRIDGMHSSIEFAVPFMGITKVRGRFDEFFGTILYDATNLAQSSVEVVMKATSINTGVEKRDVDLRSAQYFDVKNYPAITFKSRRCEKREGKEVAIGTFTMHGVAKEIALPFSIIGELKDAKHHEMGIVVGPMLLNRTEYGVGKVTKAYADRIFVGDEVEINILLRLIAEPPEEKALATQHPPTAMSQTEWEKFIGVYEAEAAKMKVRIEPFGNQLIMQMQGAGIAPLIPIGQATFRIKGVGGLAEFDLDAGHAQSLTIKISGQPALILPRKE